MIKYIIVVAAILIILLFLTIYIPVHHAAKSIELLREKTPKITAIMRYNGDTLDYKSYPVPID
ncbi:MAG: hypothetical protein J7K73_01605, partial [Nanoarchaeota archaeon]|nr:hypothetical protein [Nanoarchaeota archaeon]